MPRLEPAMARIRVKDPRLRTFIGIKDEEIRNKQDVLDQLDHALSRRRGGARQRHRACAELPHHYQGEITIQHVEDNRFALLERLTQEILDLIMLHPQVRYAEVEVDKPHALRFAESVPITVAAHRD